MLQCLPLPLHLLALYAADTLPVSLLHAETGFQGRVSARQTADGRQVGTNGDLQVNTRPATGARANGGDPLLTWQSLPLQGLTVALAPPARPRFKVRAMALTDFYSRLTITVEGRINLQDVAAQGPAGAASRVDLVLGPTQLRNGRIDFTDRFMRPNHSVRSTDLNGSIGALRSDTRGRDRPPLDTAGAAQPVHPLSRTARFWPLES